MPFWYEAIASWNFSWADWANPSPTSAWATHSASSMAPQIVALRV
jgi:hypothetical protein